MHLKIISWALIITSSALGSFFIVQELNSYIFEQEVFISMRSGLPSNDLEVLLKSKKDKPSIQVVKGVYLTAYSASNPKKVQEIIDLINRTELNAVVIDIKDYSGAILYNSQVPLVNELNNEKNIIKNLPEVIEKFHKHKIYVIARQTVFQDPLLANKKPAWALKSIQGGLWRDKNGLSWVDASRAEVWAYNVAIAKEAIDMGFDEINFDYVRFPSDGIIANIVYNNGAKKRYQVIQEFFKYLNEQLSSSSARISLDLFGFVMEKTGEDDMRIGQRLVDALNEVDYICPMMYPSHYPAGHLGLANPAASPGLVISHGIEKGLPLFGGKRAKFRPWLQAFHLGATYDAEKIRAQIEAVEKKDNAGWLLWNAANRYSTNGLKME